MDPILAAMVGEKQKQQIAITNEEQKLVAEESEVKQAVGQTKTDLQAQRAAGSEYLSTLGFADAQAQEALKANIAASEAQAKLDLSAFQAQEEKLRRRDETAAQLKANFGIDVLVSQLAPNIKAMQEQVDIYQDKAAAARQEIVDTKNPIKWAWKNLVEVPYYEKKVQENQQQLLNTFGTAGKAFQTANNAQVIADNFDTKATPDTVVANVYNLRSATLAANNEQMEAEAASTRVNNFAARYGIRKDITDQMQQLTGIIASTYNANKSTSLRASGAKGMEDILDLYKKWGELSETFNDPGQIEFFKSQGIDMSKAMSLGKVARGMYFNHATSDLPLVPSGSFKEEQEIPLLLQEGKKAVQLLPSPMNQFVGTTILDTALTEYQALKNTMSSGGDAAKFLETAQFVRGERDTLAKGSVKKINGLDLTNAFNSKYIFKYGIDDGVPRTPGQFLAESVLLAPGSAVGKELLASQKIEDLIKSGRKGSKLAQQYRSYADGKTADGRPVIAANQKLDFDMIRGMANNDADEIFAFYNAAYNLANLSLPYTALGAKPAQFEAGIPGKFVTRGFFGNDEKNWVGMPRSAEDVRKWMLQADTAKQLATAQAARRAEPFGANFRPGQ